MNYLTLFSAAILAFIFFSDASADIPTYNPALVPAITKCNAGVWLRRQTDPYNTGGDPKIRPKGYASYVAEIDPIKHSASHLHTFTGPCQVDINSERGTLLQSATATTDGGPGVDASLAWQPSLIDTRNGAVLLPAFTEIYYARAFGDTKKHMVEKTPLGLKFITGNHLATDYTQNEALAPQRGVFQCNAVTSGPTAKQSGFPLCANNSLLTIKLMAPNCVADDGTGVPTLNNTDGLIVAVDGKFYLNTSGTGGLPADGKYYLIGGNAVTDSTDHMSHMAWNKSGNWNINANECPSSHPHRIPQNVLLYVYKIADSVQVPFLKLSSDSGEQGASAHWDYIEAWHRIFYDMFFNGCLMAGIDCGLAKLGNGWQLVDMQKPADVLLSE